MKWMLRLVDFSGAGLEGAFGDDCTEFHLWLDAFRGTEKY
jgi:hypothetical protein